MFERGVTDFIRTPHALADFANKHQVQPVLHSTHAIRALMGKGNDFVEKMRFVSSSEIAWVRW